MLYTHLPEHDLLNLVDTFKAFGVGDDSYIDEEGRYLVFRQVGGKTIPIWTTVEDFAEELRSLGIEFDPADQKALRQIEEIQAQLARVGQEYGMDAMQLAQENIIDQLTEAQQAVYNEWHAQEKLRREIMLRHRDRLHEGQASKRGTTKDELVAEKAKRFEEITKENAVERANQMEDLGWESVIATWTHGTEDRYAYTAKGQLMLAMDVLAMRALSLRQNGEDISNLTLSDLLAAERKDMSTLTSRYQDRYRGLFDKTADGYIGLSNGFRHLEHTLKNDSAAANTLSNAMGHVVSGIQRDFDEREDFRRQAFKPEVVAVESSLEKAGFGRKLSGKLPDTYSPTESHRLQEYASPSSDSKTAYNNRVRSTSRHLIARVMTAAGFSAEDMLEEGLSPDDVYRSAFTAAYHDLEGGMARTADELVHSSTYLVEKYLTGGSYSTEETAQVLRKLAFNQGYMDALGEHKTQIGVKSPGAFAKKADGINRTGARITDAITDIAKDPKSAGNYLIGNSALRLRYEEAGAGTSPTPDVTSTQPHQPAATDETLETFSLNPDTMRMETASGHYIDSTATLESAAEELGGIEADEDADTVSILRDPDGVALSAVAYNKTQVDSKRLVETFARDIAAASSIKEPEPRVDSEATSIVGSMLTNLINRETLSDEDKEVFDGVFDRFTRATGVIIDEADGSAMMEPGENSPRHGLSLAGLTVDSDTGDLVLSIDDSDFSVDGDEDGDMTYHGSQIIEALDLYLGGIGATLSEEGSEEKSDPQEDKTNDRRAAIKADRERRAESAPEPEPEEAGTTEAGSAGEEGSVEDIEAPATETEEQTEQPSTPQTETPVGVEEESGENDGIFPDTDGEEPEENVSEEIFLEDDEEATVQEPESEEIFLSDDDPAPDTTPAEPATPTEPATSTPQRERPGVMGGGDSGAPAGVVEDTRVANLTETGTPDVSTVSREGEPAGGEVFSDTTNPVEVPETTGEPVEEGAYSGDRVPREFGEGNVGEPVPEGTYSGSPRRPEPPAYQRFLEEAPPPAYTQQDEVPRGEFSGNRVAQEPSERNVGEEVPQGAYTGNRVIPQDAPERNVGEEVPRGTYTEGSRAPVEKPTFERPRRTFGDRLREAFGRRGGGAESPRPPLIDQSYSNINRVVTSPSSGGGTFPLFEGDEAPTTGYTVSREGFERRVSPKDMSREQVRSYLNEVSDKAEPGEYLGVWRDDETGEYVFDLSRNFDNEAEASAYARRNNQKAYFDVASGKARNLGTSTPVGEQERLFDAPKGGDDTPELAPEEPRVEVQDNQPSLFDSKPEPKKAAPKTTEKAPKASPAKPKAAAEEKTKTAKPTSKAPAKEPATKAPDNTPSKAAPAAKPNTPTKEKEEAPAAEKNVAEKKPETEKPKTEKKPEPAPKKAAESKVEKKAEAEKKSEPTAESPKPVQAKTEAQPAAKEAPQTKEEKPAEKPAKTPAKSRKAKAPVKESPKAEESPPEEADENPDIDPLMDGTDATERAGKETRRVKKDSLKESDSDKFGEGGITSAVKELTPEERAAREKSAKKERAEREAARKAEREAASREVEQREKEAVERVRQEIKDSGMYVGKGKKEKAAGRKSDTALAEEYPLSETPPGESETEAPEVSETLRSSLSEESAAALDKLISDTSTAKKKPYDRVTTGEDGTLRFYNKGFRVVVRDDGDGGLEASQERRIGDNYHDTMEVLWGDEITPKALKKYLSGTIKSANYVEFL